MYALLHQTPVNFKIYCCQTHDAIPMPKTTCKIEIFDNKTTCVDSKLDNYKYSF